jgi:hypothetical protein
MFLFLFLNEKRYDSKRALARLMVILVQLYAFMGKPYWKAWLEISVTGHIAA